MTMHCLRRIDPTFRLCNIVLALLALFATSAFAQELRMQEPSSQSTPEGLGLLNEIGRLLKSPADLLPSFSKTDTAPTPEPAQPPPPVTSAPIAPPPATKPPAPASAVITPPPVAIAPPPVAEPPAAASTRLFPGMVSGREVCPRSANGAPDCQVGTDKLCQSKGYKGGKSLNMDSAFTCSPRQARADGRKPCGTEHFVTSAFCQ